MPNSKPNTHLNHPNHATPDTKAGRLRRLLKDLLIYGSVFLVLYTAVNWWRQPAMPVDAAAVFLSRQDIQGNAITLPEHDALLVYFWGTWCSICHYSSPKVAALSQTAPVISVAVSSGSDGEVRAFMQNKGYHFSTINDSDGAIFQAWQGQVTPSYAIIKDGKMVQGFTGVQPLWVLKARLLWANLTG